jgi:hypothetical protein
VSDNIDQPNPFEPSQAQQIASDVSETPEPSPPPEVAERFVEHFSAVYGWMLFLAATSAIYGANVVYYAWSYHAYGQELEALGESLLPSYSMYTRADFMIGILNFIIAILLCRAALSARHAATTGSVGALDDALDLERHYWVYCGILVAVELVIFFGARLYDYLEQRSAAVV